MNLKNNIFGMTLTDLKIYGLNLTTFGISFTDIDILLKIVLVGISIGYTIHKWIIMLDKHKCLAKDIIELAKQYGSEAGVGGDIEYKKSDKMKQLIEILKSEEDKKYE